MTKTGTNFEMNPDTFTLENMFAMELHKYADVISDIVASAVKELSIEKVRTPCYGYTFHPFRMKKGTF